MKAKIIQRIPLFASLPSGEIQHLAETLRDLTLPPNTIVFHEGEYGDRFYIVVEGEIEVIKSLGTADERVLALCGPGSYVGEMSLFDRDGRRTASVRTRTPAQLLEMTRGDFDALLHRQPMLAYELVHELSARLDSAHTTTIRDLREKNRQLEQAYEELKTAQAQIIEKEKLEKELAVARQIQASILPSTFPQVAGFDLGARVVPTRAVGGDLFDLIDLGNGRLGVAVADVSDKGVPAAIFMALTRSLLRAEATRTVSPVEVVRNVNRELLEMNDAGMFVTVLYGVLDGATLEFHYVRAGHEMPLVVGPDGELIEIPQGSGNPVGLFEGMALDEQRVTLARGSVLVINTDGATDQENSAGEPFGFERLRAAVCGQRSGDAQTICDRLFAARLSKTTTSPLWWCNFNE
ncbi:MAG: SpoIIE family protein phosphatase [Chloroflexi bacterium]|nr:SpoIIE family protein phosphatase [Chloroflexota bacterium]